MLTKPVNKRVVLSTKIAFILKRVNFLFVGKFFFGAKHAQIPQYVQFASKIRVKRTQRSAHKNATRITLTTQQLMLKASARITVTVSLRITSKMRNSSNFFLDVESALKIC